MKQLNNFIIEKLKINKDIKVNNYNPDELNNQNELFYDSEDTSLVEESDYIIDDINNNAEGFFCCRYDSLSKIYGKSEKVFEDTLYEICVDLHDMFEKVITGKDAGYEGRIKGGHIEIDCINSGSRSTYYIYSINKRGYDELCAWFEAGWEEVESLDFLYEEGTIEEIKI